MNKGPRARVSIALLAGLLVLSGTGCASRTVPIAPSLERQPEVSLQAATSSQVSEEERSWRSSEQFVLPYRSCVDETSYSVPWRFTKAHDLAIQSLSKVNVELLDEALQKKYDEGWKVKLFCLEPLKGVIYFSMWDLRGMIKPEIYAAAPGTPAPRGTASVLGIMEWSDSGIAGDDGAATSTKIHFSRRIGIQGNGDADSFRDISWRNGVLYGDISTGTLSAETRYIPGGTTKIENVCTMNPFSESSDLDTNCYPHT